MNDELSLKSPPTQNRHRLEERLARRPELLERLHEIVDTLEQSVSDGCDAHDAEDRVVDEIRNWVERSWVNGQRKPTRKCNGT